MSAPKRFQPPTGTRDFFPADMAVRRHVEQIWRQVALRHGFDEIDGPTFEHLELYTVKSGDEIVSELFSFRRAGGEKDYALRPEFTPTLARMVAAHGSDYPKPIRWYSIAPMFRAERPQRGRLREHIQWNCDVLGDPSPRAEVDILAAAAHTLALLGLDPAEVRIRISHRDLVTLLLTRLGGVAAEALTPALAWLDRRLKMEPVTFRARAGELGIATEALECLDELAGAPRPARALLGPAVDALGTRFGAIADGHPALKHLREIATRLEAAGVLDWCDLDLGVVRGLAYYTGTVFEIHEASGAERAIAGGGRYDRLVELFGGPPTPAFGFAMGDVVIRLVLEDRGRLGPRESYLPRPDAFVIDLAAGAPHLDAVLMQLRRAGFHARASGRSSTNLGKLLGDAAKARARTAVIIGSEFERGEVAVKDLDRGAQQVIPLAALDGTLRAILHGGAAPD